jgi:hypothetical protein
MKGMEEVKTAEIELTTDFPLLTVGITLLL